MNLKFIIVLIISSLSLISCTDNDNFSIANSGALTFGVDTLKMDTIFSNVPSSTREFWIHNNTSSGIRINNVRLQGGNQNGFRVNVDGLYLSQTFGYQVQDLEIRKGDSIRVFVELTAPINNSNNITLIEDKLTFTLEGGAQDNVILNAYTWDAVSYTNLHVKEDLILNNNKPIIIYGRVRVDSTATLTINEGTTLYLHSGAGIDVFGKININGTANNNVTLRGDRLDKMFDYLPYNNVSGQWEGIHIYPSSKDNRIYYTDIHSANNAIEIDTASINDVRLHIFSSNVHNSRGYGMIANNANTLIENSLFTNAGSDCLYINGGIANINNTTIAQFYPFSSSRGAALRISAATYSLENFLCQNSLITGFADDVIMGNRGNNATNNFNYLFSHCLLRTPEVKSEDSQYYTSIIFENATDTAQMGTKNFKNIDVTNLRYNFHLSSISRAIEKADNTTSLPADRDGNLRNTFDLGAYVYTEE